MKTVKKTILLTASVVFLVAIPLLDASMGAPIELRLAHWASSLSRVQDDVKLGADWIEKRFPGRVKITIYPAQTLLPAASLYEGTAKGIADIAYVVPGWTPGRFPKTEVIDLPPGIPLASDASRVYWDFYKKFLTDEWNEVKVLGFNVQQPQGIHTKKTSVRTFKDIKGEKIRVYGVGKEIITAFGGVPVAMPMSEVYEATRLGVIDGVFAPFSAMKDYRLIETCFHHTVLDTYASPFFLVMNLKKYNVLPPDIKKTLDEEFPEYFMKEAGKISDRWEEIGRELVKKTPGHEFIILSPEEKSVWIERAKTINGPWASALEARGLPGKRLVEEKLRAIEKYVK